MIAIMIGIALLIITVRSVMNGMMPRAIMCGVALITMLSPILGLLLAILALIIFGLMGAGYLGGRAILGWLLGIVLILVAAGGIALLMVSTAVSPILGIIVAVVSVIVIVAIVRKVM